MLVVRAVQVRIAAAQAVRVVVLLVRREVAQAQAQDVDRLILLITKYYSKQTTLTVNLLGLFLIVNTIKNCYHETVSNY